jgi:ABC-2 type transport system permease protein
MVTMLFYPSLRDSPAFDEMAAELPEALMRAFAGDIADFTSPEGFLNSQLFVLIVPLLFMVLAVARGSGAIAGEEERGTLDLLLSSPVRRWRVLIEKFAAMVVAIGGVGLALWLGMAVGARIVDMEISVWRIGEATLSAGLLGMSFGAVALAVGSATGKRGLSMGATSALGVAAYFVNALAPLAEGIEGLQKLSPFYYYIGGSPLVNGLNLAHAGVLVALTAVAVAVALVTFQRRDLAA